VVGVLVGVLVAVLVGVRVRVAVAAANSEADAPPNEAMANKKADSRTKNTNIWRFKDLYNIFTSRRNKTVYGGDISRPTAGITRAAKRSGAASGACRVGPGNDRPTLRPNPAQPVRLE
jgi:hypothetical protein